MFVEMRGKREGDRVHAFTFIDETDSKNRGGMTFKHLQTRVVGHGPQSNGPISRRRGQTLVDR